MAKVKVKIIKPFRDRLELDRNGFGKFYPAFSTFECSKNQAKEVVESGRGVLIEDKDGKPKDIEKNKINNGNR